MKKLVIILLISVFMFSLFAGVTQETITYKQTNIREDLKLSVTIANVVYFGVTDKAINSSIVPSTNFSEVELKFDANTHTYKLDTMYFYVLSFITKPIKVTLDVTKLVLNGSETSLDYTAKLTNTIAKNADNKLETQDIKTTEFGKDKSKSYTLIEESATSYDQARVWGWSFEFALDSNAQSFELSSGSSYEATFTMTVSAK